MTEKDDAKQQSKAFLDAARKLECDESEERFNAVLGQIVRHKPMPDSPPEKAETRDGNEPAK